ncbi:flagellin/flagellar hook associated protein [Terriglobus roseus DSM 18391]|uniref:Flagellin n=1 Tax=Terriglobus roseus (strain DSM 18391 / NRRL B-41598 / KBS 63) TaxID=926566 RepID=I3ZFX9_TERRK|nr:flagellin [Terriglobus roseus]AFL88147.1 flagellin/flagellar hook associated protein [Terriglobus roseus DSM 18391]
MLSSNSSLQSLLTSLSDMNARQTKISQETSSGVRLTALSDDASAAGQAVTMADTLRRDDAFVATANTVGSRMQAADTALSSVVAQMTSAISTAVGALTDGTTATARATAAQQLGSIRDSLVSLANSSYSGSYLFSGSGTVAPFTEDASGNVTYAGDAQTTSVTLTSGSKLQSSLAGASVFLASGASVFTALNDAIAALQPNASANAATVTGALRSALDNVTSQRAVLNTAQARLSSESTYVSTQKTNLTADQTTLLSADTATLATELSAVTTQRSALLSTIGIVQKGSLFDYL